ncbi:MAG: hypothetical protein P8N02_19570, partial [Actinomycetota bacterium]|nr:hypothetical protein [Actinomycetota bacterium]
MNQRAQWVVERWRGSAGLLHHRPMPVDGRRRVSVLDVTRPALALGSRTPDPVGDVGPDVDVTTRRSGGGVVWLQPDNSTWIDVFVPADDALADDDVGRAFLWLGEVFELAAAEMGVAAAVYRGPHVPGP